MTPSHDSTASTATLVVAVDAGTPDNAAAEHLLHEVDGLLAAVGDPSDLATTHVVRRPPAHTAVVLAWEGEESPDPGTVVRLLADALPGAGVVVRPGGATAGPDDLVSGAAAALDEHLRRSAGRLVRFPGQEALDRRLTAAEVVALTCVDAVEGLAGTDVGPGTVVDLSDFVRPAWHDGRCVVLVQLSQQGLVPFEVRHQVPCCSSH